MKKINFQFSRPSLHTGTAKVLVIIACLAIGYGVGLGYGYANGLNWCYQNGVKFLELKGYNLEFNWEANPSAYKILDPNSPSGEKLRNAYNLWNQGR